MTGEPSSARAHRPGLLAPPPPRARALRRRLRRRCAPPATPRSSRSDHTRRCSASASGAGRTTRATWAPSMRRDADEDELVLAGLATLHVHGAAVDWHAVAGHGAGPPGGCRRIRGSGSRTGRRPPRRPVRPRPRRWPAVVAAAETQAEQVPVDLDLGRYADGGSLLDRVAVAASSRRCARWVCSRGGGPARRRRAHRRRSLPAHVSRTSRARGSTTSWTTGCRATDGGLRRRRAAAGRRPRPRWPRRLGVRGCRAPPAIRRAVRPQPGRGGVR